MFKKNTSGQIIHFQGVDASTGGIKSGVSWTVRRCIDGTFAAATGTVTEDGSTGWYKFAMSQADTNGNNIGFNFTGTGAVPQTVNIITDGAPPDINLKSILGTALTETAGQIAAGFKKVFDVASPVFTAQSVNQTGDSYARIGAPAGASVSADVAAVKTQTNNIETDTQDIQSRLPATLSGDGFIKADLKSIEDELTSGNNATLNLKKLSIINSAGTALEAISSGSNGNGAYFQGNVTGFGVDILGGSSQFGLQIDGGNDAGGAVGISANSPTGNGIVVNSVGGSGVFIEGGTKGIEVYGDAGNALELNAVGGVSISAPQDIAVSDGDLTLANIKSGLSQDSDTNKLTYDSDNKVFANASVSLTSDDIDAIASAIDVWGTSLPGPYMAGQAGYIVWEIKSQTDQLTFDSDSYILSHPMTPVTLDSGEYANIADDVWDDVLTGATHNIPASAGRRLRQISDLTVIHEGEAQGGTDETITLDAGASSIDNIYQLNYITIPEGTGAGQTRVCVNYDGTTKILSVNRKWTVVPDTDSVFIVTANANALVETVGSVVAATSNTITLGSGASSDNDSYIGGTVMIASGTGREQNRIIVDYDGVTKKAFINTEWSIVPDTSSTYIVWPIGRALIVGTTALGDASIADAVLKRDWTEITGEASRSVLNALRKLRNKISFNGTNTLTVYKEDGTTSAYTQAVTSDSDQEPFKELGN